MFKTKAMLAGTLLAGLASAAHSAEFTVEVTNLTNGLYFTPLLVVAHNSNADVFEVGQPASAPLQQVAEGGALTLFEQALTPAVGVTSNNPANGLLAPGESTSAMLNTDNTDFNLLSIAAMMLPSNDAFVGLDSWEIPTEAGTYTLTVVGYDAGTEANDEIQGSGVSGEPGFPAPPPVAATSGTGGTGVPGVTAEGFVHVHRGVLGDLDLNGGVSDIDAAVHRWLNPVARITVTVQ